MANSIPLGIRILPQQNCISRESAYRLFILLFTFICYMSYHLSRKPISVVKSELHRNCSKETRPGNGSSGTNSTDNWCDWSPFENDDYKQLLGSLDLAYLFAYAVGMFISGHVAERMNMRYFLSLGMILSGIFTAAFGMGYFLSIHLLWYYILIQVIAGLFQSSGWPAVVACVGNWYGKGKRGLIMGVWNSHTSVGNILGSLIAGIWVGNAWGWSFVVPGLIIIGFGILVFFFLVPEPKDVGCLPPDHHQTNSEDPFSSRDDIYSQNQSANLNSDSDSVKGEKLRVTGEDNKVFHIEMSSDSLKSLDSEDSQGPKLIVYYCKEQISCHVGRGTDAKGKGHEINGNCQILGSVEFPIKKRETSSSNLPLIPKGEEKAISFYSALVIPGVIEFSLCLFFAKLVSYTFLFWLPNYINDNTDYDPEVSADLSTLFDVGGIAGGIAAGVFSDYTGARAVPCALMLALAAPALYIYNLYGSLNYANSVGLLLAAGFFVNGPYALITTAVSADLGTHKSLMGNSRALATVTAIIDGTGSIGAAIGPLLTGVISTYGWENVFYMLIAADVIALLLLTRLFIKELKRAVCCRTPSYDV
ncbi:hypothetical protein ACJMK2_026680 [Sinanodonta woodiana]|uniref:Major facilitator superfamily (MFS) profile domain-containing protein n=1 Tax=Sinanodonta woodiana TaxID=1069815 RepID=A0ABD3XKI4_SINWO